MGTKHANDSFVYPEMEDGGGVLLPKFKNERWL